MHTRILFTKCFTLLEDTKEDGGALIKGDMKKIYIYIDFELSSVILTTWIIIL